VCTIVSVAKNQSEENKATRSHEIVLKEKEKERLVEERKLIEEETKRLVEERKLVDAQTRQMMFEMGKCINTLYASKLNYYS